jgi:hypothetical protein
LAIPKDAKSRINETARVKRFFYEKKEEKREKKKRSSFPLWWAGLGNVFYRSRLAGDVEN